MSTEILHCMDCPAVYAEWPLDTTLPDEQWELINPGGNGVLCASCIVKRAAKLPGVIALRAVIEFVAGPADAGSHAAIDALAYIAENDPDCGCAHDTEDCCFLVGSGFCGRCYAWWALKRAASASAPAAPRETEKTE